MRREEIDLGRFAASFAARSPSECWEWSQTRLKGGYGLFGVRGITQLAHRVSYTLCRDTIPEGLYVLHSCDNPPCVNPNHLFVGTQLDNLQDAARKGRLGGNRGKPNWRRGITKYELVVNGQGVVTHECGECGNPVYRKPTDKTVSGLRFCGLSCRCAYFNRRRRKTA